MGWSEGFQSLGRWIGQPWLPARSSVEALLMEGPKPLRELALNLIVIPERLTECGGVMLAEALDVLVKELARVGK